MGSFSEQVRGDLRERGHLLHRVLGLPTEPPPCDASTYWAIEWLSALVGAEPPVDTLADAIALHPVTHLLRRGTGIAEIDVVDVLTAFHRVLTWSRMRELAGLDRFSVPDLAPEGAAWLDDGAFARFLLNRCPPLHLLRSRLDSRLSVDLADDLLDLLDDLGIPDTTWPDLARRPRPAA